MATLQIFQILKLAADLLLVGAIGFLGLRILKTGDLSGKASELMMLETSLKGLIKESESASRHLNDELQRRQNSLERLLSELDGTEKRLNQNIASTAEIRPQIEKKIQEGRALVIELSQSVSEVQQQSSSKIRQPAAPSFVEPAPAAEIAPEPPSFEQVVQKDIPKHKLHARGRASANPQPLAARIEREVSPAPANAAATDKLEKIYQAVEVMINAGHDLQTIARMTRLPIERIKLLAEMKSEDKESKATEKDRIQEGNALTEKDPRLGVLGSMKRQMQTL